MNLPNKLTLMRIILVPFFMVFAALGFSAGSPAYYLIAGILFAAASLTDYLDGHIARSRNMVTDFGKFADPLADKLLTTTAFLYMMQDGACSVVVLVLILAREFAVSGLRMVAAGAKDGKVIAANMWGKCKTVLQMVVILLYYFGRGLLGADMALMVSSFAYALCWVVAAVTLISGLKMLVDNRSFINTAK